MPWPRLKGFEKEDAGMNVDKFVVAVRVRGERGERDGTDDEGG